MKRHTSMYCNDCAAAFDVIFDLDAVMENTKPEDQIDCCPICSFYKIDYVGHVDLEGT